MSAIGELIVWCIFILLGLGSIVLFIFTFTIKRSLKPWTFLGSIFLCFLFFSYRASINYAYRQKQLDQVGIYYLTAYPSCTDCILELKEDLTYEIRREDKIIKKSNWHFESGGDYWITWLDNEKYQLGYGDYSYKSFKLKFVKQSKWHKSERPTVYLQNFGRTRVNSAFSCY